MTVTPGSLPFNGDGDDGNAIADAQITGDRNARTGIYALEAADLFNLLCIPPLRDEPTMPALPGGCGRYCQERRAMLIVDPPAGWTANPVTAIAAAETGVSTLRGAIGNDNARNAAVYFPRLRMPDPLAENRLADFAPCGAVAGIMARTDAQRGRLEGAGGPGGHLLRRPGLHLHHDRRRERRAQPARAQLPAHLPGQRQRGLGRAHPGRRRSAGLRVEVRPGPPPRALHRGEPLSRHPVGGVRAQRRAALGADPPQRRRLHAEPVPPGRLPGANARARPTSSSATGRPRPRTTSTSASSTSWSASRRSSRPSSWSSRSSRWPARSSV